MSAGFYADCNIVLGDFEMNATATKQEKCLKIFNAYSDKAGELLRAGAISENVKYSELATMLMAHDMAEGTHTHHARDHRAGGAVAPCRNIYCLNSYYFRTYYPTMCVTHVFP
jgi:hypothetical protein